MTRRGFTLIELLIVVAIIAILAAIAVPNFLEAQTRSRASRAQNDLRTIALGMESYRVDNNGYPAGQNKSPLQPTAARDELDLRLLTTPLSYIATVPGDVFRLVAGRDVEEHLGGSVPGQYRVYGVSYPTDRRSFSVYPKTAWMTWSIGPDLLTNCGGYRCYKAVTDNEGGTDPRASGQPPGIGVDKNGNWITSHTGDYWGMRYDPTNGTVSYGDIYRFEGEAITRPNV